MLCDTDIENVLITIDPVMSDLALNAEKAPPFIFNIVTTERIRDVFPETSSVHS